MFLIHSLANTLRNLQQMRQHLHHNLRKQANVYHLEGFSLKFIPYAHDKNCNPTIRHRW